MLKKSILLFVALLLILTMSACSSNSGNNDTSPPKSDETEHVSQDNDSSGERFEIDTSENLFGEGINAPNEVVVLANGYWHSANLGMKAWQSPPTIEAGDTADVYAYDISGYTIEEIFDFYNDHFSDYVVDTVENFDNIKYIEFIVGDYSENGDGYGGVVDLSFEDDTVTVAFWIYYYE